VVILILVEKLLQFLGFYLIVFFLFLIAEVITSVLAFQLYFS